MRFFDVSEQSFRTGPDGRRLFHVFGPWSRPYIVPDAATEQRLAGIQRWMLGALVGLVIVGQLLMRAYDESIINTWWGFLGYVGFVVVGYQLVQRVILRDALRGLARAESRLPLRDYYAGMASRHSVAYLVLTLMMSLVFVGLGAGMLLSDKELLINWIAIIIFGFSAATTMYALVLKLRQPAA